MNSTVHALLCRLRPRIEWTGYCRGCYVRRTNTIYLPLALKKYSAGYRRYYVAHELAHALSGIRGHGRRFQEVLHRLAPDVHHFEREYQPRQYAAFKRRMRR